MKFETFKDYNCNGLCLEISNGKNVENKNFRQRTVEENQISNALR